MSILLSHGYFLADDPKEQGIMRPYPPLGLLYLSAWLEQNGVENTVFDTTFSNRVAFEAFMSNMQPTILALYTNLMTKKSVLQIMAFVRTQASLQNTLIVLGGPDVTHNAADYLRHGADLVVIGEGEQTLLEIAQAVSQPDLSARFFDLPGLAFLLQNGELFKTASREKIRDIDELPFPNRAKIDLQQYLDAWKNAHGHSTISLSTQRGCPYTCRWCSTAVYGQSYRRRSPKNVVDEMAFLQKNYDFDQIWFVDDVFTVSHKWLREFNTELKARGVRISFECITRADRLTDEMLDILKESGCFRVWIGAESGSQRIIDAMDRRVDVGQVRDMIRSARRAGIASGTFIMLGYPGETEDDIRQTVQHLKAANPDIFTITVAYPIKGTGLYEEVESSAFSALPWAEHTDRDLDFPRTYPRRYYDFAVRWTVNSLHLHKAYLHNKHLTFSGLKVFVKISAARMGMWWYRS